MFPIFSKWTLYQCFGLVGLISLFIFVDGLREGFSTSPSSNVSIFSTAGVLFILVTFFYLMLFFQLKKIPNLMDFKIWTFMPFIVIVMLILSTIIFILLATVGPLMNWVEQWNGLLYTAMVYFVLLFYLFVIGMVYKWSSFKDNVIHYAYLWTIGFMLVVIFLI